MKKIVFSLITILIMLTTCQVFGATYNFNFTGPTEATNGQTVTLTVTGTGLTGKVLLTASNATLSNSQVWVEKNSVNVTAKITGFPATITATPSEMTDNDYNIVSISAKTVTIKEKKTEVVVPPPSGGGNAGGGTSGGGTNSGGNSGTNSGGGTSSGNNRPSNPSTTKPSTKPSTGTSSQQSPDKTSVPNESNIQNSGEVKSGNNYLQSINVSVGNLNPEFYRETFEYTVENIPDEVMEMEISAVAEDEKSSISGLGKVTLEEGENRLSISVTAENGNVREYILVVNKKEKIKESDLRLSGLEISKINRNGEFELLELPFDKEMFNYSLNVEEDITDLDVKPTVEREGIIVEVTGDKNLQAGENEVLINLTAQDNPEIKTTYVIRVNKEAAVETLAQVVKMNETWKVVTICILLVVLAGEIIWYVILCRRKKTIRKH